ncbi:MAG: hypothetical protein SAJ37_05995 [Oscillatoria sp. PMC 1068.18]|nr:hypothetical protein [Oscillatoria sp. PMC 1076.18]MEC4988283.1 hypothetical protein [Oscillatoria sp. PMC 1068.18]
MPPHKAQKIDLNAEYPCPCRRKGCLQPITLTEAMGCDRCQQIFVVEENGYVLEQLSTSYPYKRSWRWSGHRWITANTGLRESYLPIAMCIILVPLIVWLPVALRLPPSQNVIFWALLVVLVLLLPALMVWLAYRR